MRTPVTTMRALRFKDKEGVPWLLIRGNPDVVLTIKDGEIVVRHRGYPNEVQVPTSIVLDACHKPPRLKHLKERAEEILRLLSA
jgi:hypothetical protein